MTEGDFRVVKSNFLYDMNAAQDSKYMDSGYTPALSGSFGFISCFQAEEGGHLRIEMACQPEHLMTILHTV